MYTSRGKIETKKLGAQTDLLTHSRVSQTRLDFFSDKALEVILYFTKKVPGYAHSTVMIT